MTACDNLIDIGRGDEGYAKKLTSPHYGYGEVFYYTIRGEIC